MSRRLFTLGLWLRRPRCWWAGHPRYTITTYDGRGNAIVGEGCRCGKVGEVRSYGGRFPQPKAN